MTTIERRPSRTVIACVAVALIASAIAWVVARSAETDEVIPTTSAAPTSSSASVDVSSRTTIGVATTASIFVGVPKALPTSSGVLLFVYTGAAVHRIDLDHGMVASIPVGPVSSTAPVFLAVGPNATVLRPYDNVQGFVLSETGSVGAPSGLLNGGAWLVCADGRRDRLWLAREPLVHVGYDGSLKAQVGTGGQRPDFIGCDGAGEILFKSGGDTYVTGGDLPQRVASTDVIAAGPRTFVVRDCEATIRCGSTLVDRQSGARRPLAVSDTELQLPPPVGQLGSVSPDGRTAALFNMQSREVLFVDLEADVIGGVSSIAGEFQSFAWSADSRYLFWINGNNKLVAFDRNTRDFIPLGIDGALAISTRPN